MKTNWTAMILVACFLATFSTAQENRSKFKEGQQLFEKGKYGEALKILRFLEQQNDVDDNFKAEVQWSLYSTLSKLERKSRDKQDWKTSLEYAKACVSVLEKFKSHQPDDLMREYVACKNVILACYGLSEIEKAKPFRDRLYAAYKNETLPEFMKKGFNFEFFRFDDKNVWGYENFVKLGDPESEGSFTKIVYLVYSSKKDGTDNKQLYRLHVLKFHKILDDPGFDYVLTKQWEADKKEYSAMYPEYTYSSPINMEKLRKDIRQFLKDDPRPYLSSSTEQGDSEKVKEKANDKNEE